MNWPIKIINGGKTPYTGTVHTGLPVPQGVVFVAPNICAVPVAGSPVRYEACATILNRNSDTSARFMLVGVTGTFQPGTTELLLQILPGSAPTTFIPENFMLARTAVFEVDWVDAAGKITKSSVNFGQLSNNITTTWNTSGVYLLTEWSGSFSSTVGWRLFVEARKGEPGVRFEFMIENRGAGFHDGGQPVIVRSARIRVDQPMKPAEPDIALAWGDPSKPCRVGNLAIAHGGEKPPIKMFWTSNAVIAEWITPESRYPQGGMYAVPTYPGQARPAGDSQMLASSDLGLFVWEKLSVSCFVGGPLDIEHVNEPPMLTWSDVERYEKHLIGGIEPAVPFLDSSGAFKQTTIARYDRLHAAYVDPKACDPQGGLKAHNAVQTTVGGAVIWMEQMSPSTQQPVDAAFVDHRGARPVVWRDDGGNLVPLDFVAGPQGGDLVTHERFVERGGTYSLPRSQNLHLGVVHYGDHVWGDGKSGAAHYDVDHSALHEFIRSGDFRWWQQASRMLTHLRTVDFAWPSNPVAEQNPRRNEGLALYEKGHNHGNFNQPLITHNWVGGACLAWCLTGHPEYLRLATHAAMHALRFELHTGTAVPADWVIGSAKDPRDFGAPSTARRRGSTTSSVAAGWYGDWGIRSPARVLELAAALKVYIADGIYDWVADALFEKLATAVQRVETGIWGGRGFILNRGGRAGDYYDEEQGWMHAYLVRGLGYALIYGDPVRMAPFQPLYDRMYKWLLACTAYGYSTPAGVILPRPSSDFDESGPITDLRPGISQATLNLWYPWRDDVTNRAKFDAWYAGIQADKTRLTDYVSPSGFTAWINDNPAFRAYLKNIDAVKMKWDAGTTPSTSDPEYQFLLANQWAWFEQRRFPNMNHCLIAADALAQGALELGHPEGETLALRYIEGVSWHWQEDAPKPHAVVTANPSAVAYRMAQFPNSESKVNGNLLETRYARRLLSLLDQTDRAVWDASVVLPPENEVDPFLPPATLVLDVNMRSSPYTPESGLTPQVVKTSVLSGL